MIYFFNFKVKIVEPVLKNNTNITLNKSNIMEANLKLSAGSTEELQIKYTVEHPVGEEIDFFSNSNGSSGGLFGR